MRTVDEYRSALHDPDEWVTRSVALYQSAEAVWNAGRSSGFKPGSNIPRPESPLDLLQCFGYYKVAMMLYGLAVETALKGILIAQKSDKILVTLETDGGGVIHRVTLKATGDSGGGHDLVSLAKNAGVVSPDDRKDSEAKVHLQDLSDYVAWRGRYPVPKTFATSNEEQERLSNKETIVYVRQLLRTHLKYST